MASMQFDLDVELEDGSTYTVTADQRDIAKFEMSKDGYAFNLAEERGMMPIFRFIAWNALRRTGQTTLGWAAFDDVLIEAMPTDEEDPTGVGPTNADPSA